MQANYKELSKDAILYDELIKKLYEGKKVAFRDTCAYDEDTGKLLNVKYMYKRGSHTIAKLGNGKEIPCRIDIFEVGKYVGEYKPKVVNIELTCIQYKDGVGVPVEMQGIKVSDEYLEDDCFTEDLLKYIQNYYFQSEKYNSCDIKVKVTGKSESEAIYIRRG